MTAFPPDVREKTATTNSLCVKKHIKSALRSASSAPPDVCDDDEANDDEATAAAGRPEFDRMPHNFLRLVRFRIPTLYRCAFVSRAKRSDSETKRFASATAATAGPGDRTGRTAGLSAQLSKNACARLPHALARTRKAKQTCYILCWDSHLIGGEGGRNGALSSDFGRPRGSPEVGRQRTARDR